ncbi:unnamed protein product [Brassicogethes aeneus]|uniref:Uncharacterized protein n=1 Tax=Brassicogethes aeneus TaxID=1431903 RepID=A0A9P0FK75_BRAAE|nr:unnamed protein product [Brassicogethes aeneus]
MEKKEITNVQVLYREWGFYLTALEQYARSLPYFNKAYEKNPADIGTLLGRSWALSKVVSYKDALIDVNKAIELAPDNLIARAHKALITYLTCEFEEALVQNRRLIPLRKKPENFVMGVMHCTEAIQNCLGDRCGRPLRDHFIIIRRLAWKDHYASLKPFTPAPRQSLLKPEKRREKKKKKKPVEIVKEDSKEEVAIEEDYISGYYYDIRKNLDEIIPDILDTLHSDVTEEDYIPRFTKPFPYKPLQNYTKNIKNYMAEKYLESMYLDKIYLKKIRTEKGIKSPNFNGTAKIKSLALNGYKTVCYKQELLRTRRPFYYLKYLEVHSTGALKSRQDEQFQILQENATKYADKRIKALNFGLANKDWKYVLTNAENLMAFCEKTPKNLLNNRDMYMSAVYSSVCNAHYDMKRINNNQSEHDQLKRVMVTFGFPISRTPSRDSVIAQYRDNIIDHNKYITLYQERLRNAETPEELAWIYHELSRFYSDKKRYELSRLYAKKCLTEGRICDNTKWVINALTLIIKVNLLQSHKNDAKNEILRAIDVSKEIGDPAVKKFMEKALVVTTVYNFEELQGSKELEARERKIISLMADTSMKNEAAHLFRMMAIMPAKRRMSVMPGVKLEDPVKRVSNKKMSIMPGPQKEAMDLDYY